MMSMSQSAEDGGSGKVNKQASMTKGGKGVPAVEGMLGQSLFLVYGWCVCRDPISVPK